MIEAKPFKIEKTETFRKWLKKLKDKKAVALIASRLLRVQSGNLGDVKHIENDVFEMRFFIGASYRVYYWQPEKERLIFLLCGGDKSTQSKDIKKP